MPEPAHNDLRRAESLRREGKLQEALEVINKIEKKGDLTPGDRLSLLISKGKILTVYQRHAESIQVGELAYQLSQALGRVEDSIFALQFKANKLFLGEPNVALDYLLEAEKLLNSLTDVSPSFLSRQRANILYRRAWANSSKGDSDTALETALECLELRKKFGRKIDIAYIYELLSYIYNGKADNNVALDYALKSLEIFKELGNSIGQATLLAQAGFLSYITGDINNALMYCKKSLSTELIGDRTKLNNLLYIGLSYNMKGEIDRALRYYKRGSSLAEELNDYNYFILSQNLIGSIYLQKKNYDLAIDYLKPSLALAKNTNHAVGIIQSLTWLGMIYLDLDLSSELQE
ncbi:MAG: tetratricopeptide repeat protein, partial [Candidatus Thorarchaeota archaeon]